MLMCTDLQWNARLQIIVYKQLFLKIVRCVCKCVKPCAVAKRQLCVEHHKCADQKFSTANEIEGCPAKQGIR